MPLIVSHIYEEALNYISEWVGAMEIEWYFRQMHTCVLIYCRKLAFQSFSSAFDDSWQFCVAQKIKTTATILSIVATSQQQKRGHLTTTRPCPDIAVTSSPTELPQKDNKSTSAPLLPVISKVFFGPGKGSGDSGCLLAGWYTGGWYWEGWYWGLILVTDTERADTGGWY